MRNTGMNQILPHKNVGPVFCLHQKRKKLWMQLFLWISEINFQWKTSDQLAQVSIGDVQFIAKAMERHGQLIKFSTTFWKWRFNYLWRQFQRYSTYLNKRRDACYIFTPQMWRLFDGGFCLKVDAKKNGFNYGRIIFGI